ncbi:short-subunit dehydrogenase [Salirhabdus euzebyi]|uniref:Short-subunit dehydrogenase n=1 Tax=Salirhabdus euzebyi TaxID=394506 RepID=A0A841PWJ5_9BACI|nr:SDR family NAD(P)-dependent oxidoreductase [Salirhabdus euzebyi]MBB6451696.1 short-subunit dehydrogenase [Salirhabdus euzebyi]
MGNKSKNGKLNGKRILITGAAGGIATEAIRLFKKEGAQVIGIDLSADEDIIQADIRDVEAVKRAVAEAESRMGGIDVLINNAGIGSPQDSGEFPSEKARLVMDVNLFGTWNMTAAALPALIKSRGHVINVASGLALANVAYNAVYSASKRAITSYSDVLRQEYKSRIHVTTLYPAFMRTNITKKSSIGDTVRVETVQHAANALLKAIIQKPRDLTTSRRSGFEMFMARHFRRTVDRILLNRSKKIELKRGKPSFVKDFTEQTVPDEIN